MPKNTQQNLSIIAGCNAAFERNTQGAGLATAICPDVLVQDINRRDKIDCITLAFLQGDTKHQSFPAISRAELPQVIGGGARPQPAYVGEADIGSTGVDFVQLMAQLDQMSTLIEASGVRK